MNNKNIFIICLLVCALHFYNKNLKNNLILVCLFGLYFVLFYNNIDEHMTSDEAVQNLASMYNSGTLTATNVNITGNLTVNGKSVLAGETSVNGQLTTNSNSIFNSDVRMKKNVSIDNNLDITGKTTMNSNLELNENLKMKDKKIIALGDIGLVYSNIPGKSGEGHFSMFRGSDGHNVMTQQVGFDQWSLYVPNGKYTGSPWGSPSAKIYDISSMVKKNTDLFV